MTKKVIDIPAALDMPSAMKFSLELSNVESAEEVVFDFRRVGHLEPFGMLIVATQLRKLKERFPKAHFTPSNYQHMGYAAHMGFFRACGVDFGKEPGEATGSAKYVPLTTLECHMLERKAAERGTDVADEVEGESRRLARMLCGEDEGDVFDTLSYSIREIMRNVVEHSNAPDIWFSAQYWPSKSKVEVAIVDLGMGLRRSLQNNPHLDASDDKRAVNYALMPAVSGKAFKGARRVQRGPWANSGFGLYLTSRICRNGGNFFIASGETGMLLTPRAQVKTYFSCQFHGTAIRMVIRTNRISNLKDALTVYREEGYAIQSRYKEIVSIDPSSASLMLSEDFNLSVWDRLLAKLKGTSGKR